MREPTPQVPHIYEGLLRQLTLQEKVALLTGADYWSTQGHPGIGLRPIRTSDGPAGVRGPRWDERDTALNVPAPVALAATWDPQRAELIGSLLATECRRKDVDVLLAPTVNLQRSPAGGRNFEFLGEDPLLTEAIAAALVRGIQRLGVAAAVKHFVANDSETERFTVNVVVSQRTLRELYLAPFEHIVRQVRPWAVMAAYNSVNGHTMTESPMLNDILKGEWGFDGLVVSDWHAARTVAGAAGGLDLVMPGPSGPWGAALVAAVEDGQVREATIDDKVLRLLRLADRVGALSQGAADEDRAPAEAGSESGRVSTPASAKVSAQGAARGDDEHARDLLRATAAAGFVLTRNEHALLPLDPKSLQRIAVIGPNAASPRTLGGGSATVFAPCRVSPLDGLRASLDHGVVIDHSPGVRSHTRIPLARSEMLYLPGRNEHGASAEFVAGDGAVLGAEQRYGGFYTWRSLPQSVPPEQLSLVRITTTVRARVAGTHVIGCSGQGRFRLYLDSALAFDARMTMPSGTDPTEAYTRPPQRSCAVSLQAAQSIEVVLEHSPTGFANQTSFVLGGVSFQLNIEEPYLPDDQEIARAVGLAEASDVAIVVVGTTDEAESEGFDRQALDLPGRQNELVWRVIEANPRTVVIVNSGSPVLLPWADAPPAILLTLFPGQEYGSALADVLLGRAEPGGRLPVTWPDSADDLPETTPHGGQLTYREGLSIGYRQSDRDAREPRYPFGHGLGYSTWDYLAADLAQPPAPLQTGAIEDPLDSIAAVVRIRLKNTGTRVSRETVQVYASRINSVVERPARWLVAFAKAETGPGAVVTTDIAVPVRSLAYWDVPDGAWAIEPGEYQLAIGRSSRDLPLTVTVVITPDANAGFTVLRPSPHDPVP